MMASIWEQNHPEPEEGKTILEKSDRNGPVVLQLVYLVNQSISQPIKKNNYKPLCDVVEEPVAR